MANLNAKEQMPFSKARLIMNVKGFVMNLVISFSVSILMVSMPIF